MKFQTRYSAIVSVFVYLLAVINAQETATVSASISVDDDNRDSHKRSANDKGNGADFKSILYTIIAIINFLLSRTLIESTSKDAFRLQANDTKCVWISKRFPISSDRVSRKCKYFLPKSCFYMILIEIQLVMSTH